MKVLKGFAPILLVILVFALIAIVGINQFSTNEADTERKLYTNVDYGFSFNYPEDDGFQVFERNKIAAGNENKSINKIDVAYPSSDQYALELFIFKSILGAEEWWGSEGKHLSEIRFNGIFSIDNTLASTLDETRSFIVEARVSETSEELGIPFTLIVASQNNFIYVIRKPLIINEDLLDSSNYILSTFKFLE